MSRGTGVVVLSAAVPSLSVFVLKQSERPVGGAENEGSFEGWLEGPWVGGAENEGSFEGWLEGPWVGGAENEGSSEKWLEGFLEGSGVAFVTGALVPNDGDTTGAGL